MASVIVDSVPLAAEREKKKEKKKKDCSSVQALFSSLPSLGF
jgi:hypothetical protein